MRVPDVKFRIEPSASTIAEMRAGAEAVARNAGVEFNEDYFDAARDMLARHTTVNEWKRRGYIRIENGDSGHRFDPVIFVGDKPFPDPLGYGSWPSALLVAQVALAIEGGLHLKKDT